jgi:hypothetical protein
MILQILLHSPLRLADIDGNYEQSLVGKLRGEVVHHSFFALAVRTPRGLELKQHHLALGRIVVELLAIECLGKESKVEALFAELKNQIGLRRFRLRRLRFVREQFFLAAAAQNINRLERFLSR